MTVPSHPWASVIVPIKDERDNLVPLTEQLLKALESRDESRSAPFEILFVDDGSTDGSSDLLDRLAADYPRVRVLHFDRNYGQSSAFDAGFKYSPGDLVITIDGDLQNDPADIGTLLPHVKTFDLVCRLLLVKKKILPLVVVLGLLQRNPRAVERKPDLFRVRSRGRERGFRPLHRALEVARIDLHQ